MADRLTIRFSRNSAALSLMFVATLAYSSTPLFVALGGTESPFFFAAVWKMGQVIGCLLFLTARFQSILFNRIVWSALRYRLLTPTMALWAIGFFDLAFFAWSTQFIDVASTTILYQTWPIILIGLTSWLFRSERRYKKLTVRTYALLVLAFLGVASVVVSQVGGLGGIEVSILPEMGIVFSLVVVAAVLVAFGAFGYRWKVDLATDLREKLDYSRESLETFGVVVGTLLASLVTLPLIASMGFVRDEPFLLESSLSGATGGIIVASRRSAATRTLKPRLVLVRLVSRKHAPVMTIRTGGALAPRGRRPSGRTWASGRAGPRSSPLARRTHWNRHSARQIPTHHIAPDTPSQNMSTTRRSSFSPPADPYPNR